MYEQIDVQQAIKRSLQTEKNARDFYRLAASYMRDTRARKTFELLAAEEAEHAQTFYAVYTGTDIPDFAAFMAVNPRRESDWLSDLEKEHVKELDERRALLLAMDKELKLEASLRMLAAQVTDEQVKAVFVKNAESTHQHYVLIESEYAHLMGMVHETDIDIYVRE